MLSVIRDAYRRMFGARRNPNFDMAIAIMAAGRADCFNSYELSPQTRAIDLASATLAEMVAAYRDLLDCINIEYPETAHNSGLADALMPKIEVAIVERFPEYVPAPEARYGRIWVQDIRLPQ